MYKVQILMSSYNGSKYIKRQIESIMNQEDVITYLFIRDDGSSDNTVDIIKDLKIIYHERIELIEGNNIGWKKSFMQLLYSSGDFEYFGFSDQDDVWFPNKLTTLIRLMEEDTEFNGVKLAHSNSLTVNPDFSVKKEQEIRREKPISHKSAIVTEYFQGCGMLWNRIAMDMIKKYMPMEDGIAHDFWVGIIGYIFGKVYFSKEPLFYHIRYGNNSSADGNVLKGRFSRLINILLSKNAYMNPAKDLLVGYGEELNVDFQKFLYRLTDYKFSYKSKILLIFDNEFVRTSTISTVFMKFAILINRF